ncbi:MAG: hypothetical protein WC375_03580 [Methanomassiliicoccales archaeon]|jgi:hypothetical protein
MTLGPAIKISKLSTQTNTVTYLGSGNGNSCPKALFPANNILYASVCPLSFINEQTYQDGVQWYPNSCITDTLDIDLTESTPNSIVISKSSERIIQVIMFGGSDKYEIEMRNGFFYGTPIIKSSLDTFQQNDQKATISNGKLVVEFFTPVGLSNTVTVDIQWRPTDEESVSRDITLSPSLKIASNKGFYFGYPYVNYQGYVGSLAYPYLFYSPYRTENGTAYSLTPRYLSLINMISIGENQFDDGGIYGVTQDYKARNAGSEFLPTYPYTYPGHIYLNMPINNKLSFTYKNAEVVNDIVTIDIDIKGRSFISNSIAIESLLGIDLGKVSTTVNDSTLTITLDLNQSVLCRVVISIYLQPYVTTTTTSSLPSTQTTTTPSYSRSKLTASQIDSRIEYTAASQTGIVDHNGGNISFGSIAPGQTSATAKMIFKVNNVPGIQNLRLGLVNTGVIPFTDKTFGIGVSSSDLDAFEPTEYFQGVNSTASSDSEYNIAIPTQSLNSSQHIYLNVALPRNYHYQLGQIRYKWFFDYAGTPEINVFTTTSSTTLNPFTSTTTGTGTEEGTETTSTITDPPTTTTQTTTCASREILVELPKVTTFSVFQNDPMITTWISISNKLATTLDSGFDYNIEAEESDTSIYAQINPRNGHAPNSYIPVTLDTSLPVGTHTNDIRVIGTYTCGGVERTISTFLDSPFNLVIKPPRPIMVTGSQFENVSVPIGGISYRLYDERYCNGVYLGNYQSGYVGPLLTKKYFLNYGSLHTFTYTIQPILTWSFNQWIINASTKIIWTADGWSSGVSSELATIIDPYVTYEGPKNRDNPSGVYIRAGSVKAYGVIADEYTRITL